MQLTVQLPKDFEQPREYSNEQSGEEQEVDADEWETEDAFVSEWSVASKDGIIQTPLKGI